MNGNHQCTCGNSQGRTSYSTLMQWFNCPAKIAVTTALISSMLFTHLNLDKMNEIINFTTATSKSFFSKIKELIDIEDGAIMIYFCVITAYYDSTESNDQQPSTSWHLISDNNVSWP